MDIWPMAKGNAYQKEVFFHEKSHYLHYGMNFTELLILSDREEDQRLRENLLEGKPLSEAMESLGCFSKKELTLIKFSEETGHVAEAFDTLYESLKGAREFREKILGLLLYPLILLFATLVFFFFALYFIIPPMDEMLGAMGQQHSLLRGLNHFQAQVPMPYIAIITLMSGYVVYKKMNRQKLVHIIFGKQYKNYEEMHTMESLYLLLHGGINILEALEILLAEGYEVAYLLDGIKEGASLSFLLEKKEASSLLLQYLRLAEETGNLEEGLFSYLLVQKAFFKELLRKKTALLEPMAIAIMGVLVFLLSMLLTLPMLDAYESL